MSFVKMKGLLLSACGRRDVDILLKNARIVNVFTGEILQGSVGIYGDRIAGFGNYRAKKVIDLCGMYLAPGFVDGHIHIESTLLTLPEFARAVVPFGTTCVVSDPHEIVNVMGKRGIGYILRAGRGLPLDIFITLPSCVPSTDLETGRYRLEAHDLEGFFARPGVVGLGEVMNFHDVIKADPRILRKIALSRGVVDGHSPALSGMELDGYISCGIGSDHECTTIEEAREKLRKGMFIMIREGTTAKNLRTLIPLITPQNERRFILVSDDRHPLDLMHGHMDHILRKAVSSGVDPVTAIRLVTLNPCEYFGMRWRGAISPGYRADLVVIGDLKDFRVCMTIKDGKVVARNGRIAPGIIPEVRAPVDNTVRINWKGMKGIEVYARGDLLRVIELVPGQILTRAITVRVRKGSLLSSDTDRDILKIVVIERHRKTGRVGVGFVRGFGLKRGAICSTIAHDSHNVVAVGTCDRDIIGAVRAVERRGGGLCVVEDGRLRGLLRLPVGGIISTHPLRRIGIHTEHLIRLAQGMGCRLPNPFMTMSFLALPVVPELRLTDRGLVDVKKGRFVSPFLNA